MIGMHWSKTPDEIRLAVLKAAGLDSKTHLFLTYNWQSLTTVEQDKINNALSDFAAKGGYSATHWQFLA